MPRNPFEQKRPPYERASPMTERTFLEFQNFIPSQVQQIEARAQKGESYADILYDIFLTESIEGRRYQETDPDYPALKENYEQEAERVLARFLAFAEKYKDADPPRISAGEKSIEKGWVYFMINGGMTLDGTAGRLYLNVAPEHLPALYEKILPVFFQAGLRVDAKFSRTANPSDLNRPDKMTIYFNDAEEEKVLKVVETAYKENPNLFLPDIPRFTAEIVDDHGFVMNGVGFGAQPVVPGNKSFNALRSEILAEVYETAKREGYPVTDPKARDRFLQLCEDQEVDPTNAAFNLPKTNPPLFQKMRRRENHILS